MTNQNNTAAQQLAALQLQLATANAQLKKIIVFPDVNHNGKPLGTINNLNTLLASYGITVVYNEMKKEPEIDIPGVVFHGDTKNNVQITYIQDLGKYSNLPTADIPLQIDYIANQKAYHPVRDWIKSIVWDGVSRLDSYYNTVETTSVMKEVLMRKWALSVVAACFREPYRFGAEGVLIFSGGQAAAKTSWVERLFPKEAITDMWIATGCSLDLHNKDTYGNALTSLITEMGEIGITFRKSDKESLKQFLTQKIDKFRAHYDRRANSYSRRTVFYGTSNLKMILNDDENRRYWPLKEVSFPDVSFDVGQFWAEIYVMYQRVIPLCDTRSDSMKSGEWGWYLSPEERAQLQVEQSEMMTVSPIIESLQDTIEDAAVCHKALNKEWENATAICKRAGIMNPNRAHTNEAAEWLKQQNYPYRWDKKFGVVFKDLTMSNYSKHEKTDNMTISATVADIRSKMNRKYNITEPK